MAELKRPDPEALLAYAQREEQKERRGRLKIFFGAAPGVGKTFAMLRAARARQLTGTDAVIGVVETHGRPETAALLEGIPVLPRKILDHRGADLAEFDLDAALARRPQLIVVDELAHTNAPGSRHTKRWQDVEELLDRGIDVFTAMNVQHVESLNDVVAQITGVTVRETVPDAMIDEADEVELVDVSPEVLLQRLREGKVYVPEQAARALTQFFRKGNLLALRELALRKTAAQVEAEMLDYRQVRGIRRPWPAAERVAVCVGATAAAARVVRAAKRLADGMQAEWYALYVETERHDRLAEADKEAVAEAFRLAEQLGGETVMLSGAGIANEILAWAQANNITKLVLGKPRPRRWSIGSRKSLVEALVEQSGAIDVYVITGEGDEPSPRPLGKRRSTTPAAYGLAVGVVALATAIAELLRQVLSLTDIAMLYLLAVVVVGSRSRYRPALLAATLSIALFDFFFVPPVLTFSVTDIRYLLTFAMMLGIAVVMVQLTARIREQFERSRLREQRTAAAYALSREVAAARNPSDIMAAAEHHLHTAFHGAVAILLPDERGMLRTDDGVAQWTFEHGQPAGLATQTLPATPAIYLPLIASGATIGVIRLEPRDRRDVSDPVRRQLLETLVGQAALGLERALLTERSRQAAVEVEAERLRTNLLSSLSHDLRTPLASIEGAASSLLDEAGKQSDEVRRELTQTILHESRRMNRLIGNLLNMIRVESGSLAVQREWQPVEEVVGIALVRLEERLQGHPIRTSIPVDLPLVSIDGILIEQVLINLLENAAKYAPSGTPIEVSAEPVPGAVIVTVADHGPGVPPDERERIFEKFYRSPLNGSGSGIGLGLTICRGIVTAHGGRIWVEDQPGGGARFRFTLPTDGAPMTALEETVPSPAAS